MAVTRMSLMTLSSAKEPPYYSSVASEALQARFFQLCQLLSLVSVSYSILLSIFLHVSWIWTPFVIALRAIPIFASVMPIIFFRKVNIHLNFLPYASAFAEIWARFIAKRFLLTIGIYSLSAFLFFFSYKFQMSDIGITTPNKTIYSLPRLNERNLYINSFAFTLAILAAVLHVAFDADRLVFSFETTGMSAQKRIVAQLDRLFRLTLAISGLMTVSFPFIYLILRRTLWSFSLIVMKKIFTLHHTDTYTGFPVSLGMLLNTFLASFLLCFFWLFANMGFGVYMTLGPSHRGELISAKSSDKNGTLVSGLETKGKPLIRMLAFQELAYIAFNKKDRRISIFADIERRTSIWTLIKVQCLGLLDEFIIPLQKKLKKVDAKPAVQEPKATPTVGVIPIKDTNIFANKVQPHHLIDGFQDKNAKASHEVIGLIEGVQSHLQGSIRGYSSLIEKVLDSKFGYPLRFTVERRAKKLVPNPMLTSTGVLALATLVCKSMDEDQYGTVQKDIAEILQKLTDASNALQSFIDSPPVHWSNTQEMNFKGVHEFEHLRNVLDSIEASFEMIVDAFYDFLPSLTLSPEIYAKINAL